MTKTTTRSALALSLALAVATPATATTILENFDDGVLDSGFSTWTSAKTGTAGSFEIIDGSHFGSKVGHSTGGTTPSDNNEGIVTNFTDYISLDWTAEIRLHRDDEAHEGPSDPPSPGGHGGFIQFGIGAPDASWDADMGDHAVGFRHHHGWRDENWGFEYLAQFIGRDDSGAGFFDPSSISGAFSDTGNDEVILRMEKSGSILTHKVDLYADGIFDLTGSRDLSDAAYSFLDSSNSSIYLSMRLAGTEIDYINITVTNPAPEPGTLAMVGLGLPLLAAGLRRRRRGNA